MSNRECERVSEKFILGNLVKVEWQYRDWTGKDWVKWQYSSLLALARMSEWKNRKKWKEVKIKVAMEKGNNPRYLILLMACLGTGWMCERTRGLSSRLLVTRRRVVTPSSTAQWTRTPSLDQLTLHLVLEYTVQCSARCTVHSVQSSVQCNVLYAATTAKRRGSQAFPLPGVMNKLKNELTSRGEDQVTERLSCGRLDS